LPSLPSTAVVAACTAKAAPATLVVRWDGDGDDGGRGGGGGGDGGATAGATSGG